MVRLPLPPEFARTVEVNGLLGGLSLGSCDGAQSQIEVTRSGSGAASSVAPSSISAQTDVFMNAKELCRVPADAIIAGAATLLCGSRSSLMPSPNTMEAQLRGTWRTCPGRGEVG